MSSVEPNQPSMFELEFDLTTSPQEDQPDPSADHRLRGAYDQTAGPDTPQQLLIQRAQSSALWAAWGDALGFISELTTPVGLLRRLGISGAPSSNELNGRNGTPVWLEREDEVWPLRDVGGWRRRVGGRSGAQAYLPAGTYSDDTQLRLATSRSIRNGRFDVDVWARLELPTFTSYGLGGGKATKSGAANMARAGSTWPDGGTASWANAGGNGVVMRVAPHAYAALASDRADSQGQMLTDVVKNGVVTHGHPRALVPACIHAIVLYRTLEVGSLAPLSVIHQWLEELHRLPSYLENDRDLGRVFVPSWERLARRSFAQAWSRTIDEMHDQVVQFASAADSNDRTGRSYAEALQAVGLLDEKTRGVGTATWVAAYWLALTQGDAPQHAIRLAANVVGSDTDTIATIAGAHLGATRPFPDLQVQDRGYLEREVVRLMAPAHPQAAPQLKYPDLLLWRAPRAQADYVGLDPVSGRTAVAALGPGVLAGQPFRAPDDEFAWQWMRMDYGQTLLIKRRSELLDLPDGVLPSSGSGSHESLPTVGPSSELDELRERASRSSSKQREKQTKPVRPNRQTATRHEPAVPTKHSTFSTEEALQLVQSSNFSPAVIGELLLRIAQDVSADAAMVFASGVVRRASELRNDSDHGSSEN